MCKTGIIKAQHDQEKHSQNFRRFASVVGQSDLLADHHLHLSLYLLVLLLVFDLLETVVRDEDFRRPLGMVGIRNGKNTG